MAVKRKLSIDLTPENRQTLEEIKKTYGIPYGDTINTILTAVLAQSPESSASLLGFLKSEMRTISAKLNVTGAYGNEQLKQQYNEYGILARCFNDWKYLTPRDLCSKEKLQKIRIKNGLLICPEDWIILNPEEAREKEYAGVVECNNSSFYHIPHFVWFRESPSVTDITLEEKESVKKMCVQKWPHFKDIIQKQVTLVSDSEYPGNYKNLDEWMRSPEIGLFTILADDNPLYDAEKKPPFGAKIIKNKKKE